MMNLKKLGGYLRDARTRTGETLRDVEGEAGVSNAYVSQLESGSIKKPSPQILGKLCDHYGISYAVAMEMAGYPVPGSPDDSRPSRLAARVGETTPEEEDALVEYLRFLRTKKE